MASCREILTLQLGPSANYVGTQWWNAQESSFQYNPNEKSTICHDVLYREGLSLNGQVTFTPRAFYVDVAKPITSISTVDETSSQSPLLWDTAKVETVDSSIKEPHEFIKDLEEGQDVGAKEYNFETTARGWADILRTRLHPKSVLMGYDKQDDLLEDRIRSYVEECDNLQGFHLILDTCTPYTEVLTHLEDEYLSKTRLAFPVLTGFQAERTWHEAATRVFSTFSCFHDCGSLSNLTVPLSCVEEFTLRSETSRTFPHTKYDPSLIYHTSGIFAAYLDTVSLSYRTTTDHSRISDTLAGLTAYGRTFAAASLALPFPMLPGSTLQQTLEGRDDEEPLWSCVSPGATTDDAWYQTVVLRGVKEDNTLLQYLQYLTSTVSASKSITSPFYTSTPFPRIFSPHVSSKGSVDPTATRVPLFQVATCPVLAGMHSSPGLGDMLLQLTTQARNIDLRRLPKLDMEVDEWENNLEVMSSTAKRHSVLMDID